MITGTVVGLVNFFKLNFSSRNIGEFQGVTKNPCEIKEIHKSHT